MLRKLLTTTAVATVLAGGAYAQTSAPATQPAPTEPTAARPAPAPLVKRAEGHLASRIIGKAVYNGTGTDAETIGDVNDLILTPEGQVEAMVIGVGGFLGVGEKDVAIEYNLVEIGERDGREILVVSTTAEALKAQEPFERAAYLPTPADVPVKETKPATAEDLAKPPAEAAPK